MPLVVVGLQMVDRFDVLYLQFSALIDRPQDILLARVLDVLDPTSLVSSQILSSTNNATYIPRLKASLMKGLIVYVCPLKNYQNPKP